MAFHFSPRRLSWIPAFNPRPVGISKQVWVRIDGPIWNSNERVRSDTWSGTALAQGLEKIFWTQLRLC